MCLWREREASAESSGRDESEVGVVFHMHVRELKPESVATLTILGNSLIDNLGNDSTPAALLDSPEQTHRQPLEDLFSWKCCGLERKD